MSNQFEREEGPPPTVTRVCVLSLSALGDLLLCLPLVTEARRLYPGVHVTLVCLRPAVAALARDLGMADAVVGLPPRARRSPLHLWRALLRVRTIRPDITLQTFASHGTFGNLVAGATGAPVCVGFGAGHQAQRLTHLVPVAEQKHIAELNLDLLRRLGHADAALPAARCLPRIEDRSSAFPSGAAQRQFGRFVVISIGSDPSQAFKRWPAEKWAQLSRRLSDVGLHPVFVGSEAERPGADAVLALVPDTGTNLAGRTNFADLAALISESEAVVATDGMLLHLASALDKPCVGIYGPTEPKVWGPWGSRCRTVTLALPCSPCYTLQTIGRPISCTTHECLRSLSVESVYRQITSLTAMPLRMIT